LEKRKILKLAQTQQVPNHVNISLVNIKEDIDRGCVDDTIKALMKACYDKNTEAIVLRIGKNLKKRKKKKKKKKIYINNYK